MPSAKVLAMRAADAARTQDARVEQATCAIADCGLAGGVSYIDRARKTMYQLKNSNLVKRGDSYVHADPAVCELVAKSREAARRRESATKLPADGAGDVPVVRDGDAPPTN